MKKYIKSYQFTISLLEKVSIKHSVHNFPSGVIMLDIWYEDKFYVLQFEDDFIGLSEVNDKTLGFDNNPDEKFYDDEKFENKLHLILK